MDNSTKNAPAQGNDDEFDFGKVEVLQFEPENSDVAEVWGLGPIYFPPTLVCP